MQAMKENFSFKMGFLCMLVKLPVKVPPTFGCILIQMQMQILTWIYTPSSKHLKHTIY